MVLRLLSPTVCWNFDLVEAVSQCQKLYMFSRHCFYSCLLAQFFPACSRSPSRGGDAAVYVLDLNQPTLPTSFLLLLFLCLFFSLWPFQLFFHSINPPDNSLLSHSVLSVVFVPVNYISLHESLPSPDIIRSVDWAQNTNYLSKSHSSIDKFPDRWPRINNCLEQWMVWASFSIVWLIRASGQTVQRESVKQTSITPLNSFEQGRTWQHPCIEILHSERLWE